MSKTLLVTTVYIDFYNHRDRKDLYRHIRLMIIKNLKCLYGHILDNRKIEIIAAILCVRLTNTIYNINHYFLTESDEPVDGINHLGLMISIDLVNGIYEVIKYTNEKMSFDNNVRERHK